MTRARRTLGCTWAGVKRGDQVYVEYERVLMPGSDRRRFTDEKEHYRLDEDPGEKHNLWPYTNHRDAVARRNLADELERLRGCSGSVAAAAAYSNPCP